VHAFVVLLQLNLSLSSSLLAHWSSSQAPELNEWRYLRRSRAQACHR
jgi:hypothetical protein